MFHQSTSELQSCDGILWKRLTEQFNSLGVQPEGLPEEALTQIYQVRHHHNLHRTLSHHCHLHIQSALNPLKLLLYKACKLLLLLLLFFFFFFFFLSQSPTQAGEVLLEMEMSSSLVQPADVPLAREIFALYI